MRFAWDTQKATINRNKHDISFEEACTIFDDVHALFLADPDVVEEERFLLLGLSATLWLLVVCHCYREHDEIIRLISVRKATKIETTTYKTRK